MITLAKGTYWTRSGYPARVTTIGKNIDDETIYQGTIGGGFQADINVWLADGTCICPDNRNCDLVDIRVVRKRKSQR